MLGRNWDETAAFWGVSTDLETFVALVPYFTLTILRMTASPDFLLSVSECVSFDFVEILYFSGVPTYFVYRDCP